MVQLLLRGRCFAAIFRPVESTPFPIDTRRLMVQRHELDLTVGDVFHVGDKTITVIDIENGEVTFRIDDHNSQDDNRTNGVSDNSTNPLPR